MNARWPAAALLAGLVAGSCSLARGERQLAAGDEHAAARAYERAADGSRARASRALLRLGVLHASPESALYDRAEARRILERLRADYPESAEAREAVLLLDGLEGEAPKLPGPPDPEPRTPPVAAPGEALLEELELERLRAEELGARLAASTAEAARLRREIARLEAELAQLKAIDLAEPPL